MPAAPECAACGQVHPAQLLLENGLILENLGYSEGRCVECTTVA